MKFVNQLIFSNMKINLFGTGKCKLSEKFGIPTERVDILLEHMHEVFKEMAPPGIMAVFESSILLTKLAEKTENMQELVCIIHIATLALMEHGTRLS